MSYEKHTWETGEIITAEKLNNLEDGVAGASGSDCHVCITPVIEPICELTGSLADISAALGDYKGLIVDKTYADGQPSADILITLSSESNDMHFKMCKSWDYYQPGYRNITLDLNLNLMLIYYSYEPSSLYLDGINDSSVVSINDWVLSMSVVTYSVDKAALDIFEECSSGKLLKVTIPDLWEGSTGYDGYISELLLPRSGFIITSFAYYIYPFSFADSDDLDGVSFDLLYKGFD